MTRIRYVFVLLTLLTLFSGGIVSAATFAHQSDYSLAKDAVVQDDLYAASDAPTISGTVNGDAAIAGGTVTMDGAVKNELFAAGGTVSIVGHVGGTARVAGGNVTIAGPVDGDLVVAGGTVSILPSATIGRDLIVMGGTVTIDGSVARNVVARASTVVINAPVGGTVNVRGNHISLGDQAVIKGALTYQSKEELNKANNAVAASIEHQPMPTSTNDRLRPGVPEIFGSIFGIGMFFIFLSYGTAAIILSIVFEDISTSIADESRELLQSIGIGFAAIILVPIAGIILFISVFGSALGVPILISYALVLILAKLFSAVVAGAWLSKWCTKDYEVSWMWSLVALAVLELLWLVPIIGWVIPSFVFLVTFGALVMQIYHYFVD